MCHGTFAIDKNVCGYSKRSHMDRAASQAKESIERGEVLRLCMHLECEPRYFTQILDKLLVGPEDRAADMRLDQQANDTKRQGRPLKKIPLRERKAAQRMPNQGTTSLSQMTIVCLATGDCDAVRA